MDITDWLDAQGVPEAHAARDEIERLRAIVKECRSSVKFDLLHYEKMARAYGNLGREGEQTAATAEAEAQRLHTLLEKIDALALTTPNVKVSGLPQPDGD